jgi:hypothetical protein
MDWRCGSDSRASCLQVQSPEFKPQTYQKKKNCWHWHLRNQIGHVAKLEMRWFTEEDGEGDVLRDIGLEIGAGIYDINFFLLQHWGFNSETQAY